MGLLLHAGHPAMTGHETVAGTIAIVLVLGIIAYGLYIASKGIGK